MPDVLIAFLMDHYPQIAGYALVALVVGVFIWKTSTFYANTSNAIKKLDEIVPLLQKLSSGFDKFNSILIEKAIISQSCYSQENSPRVMNEEGKKLYEESGAKALFDSLKDELLTEAESKKIDSLLEAEQTCLEIVLDKRDDPRFKKIQNFAFQHPTFLGKPLTYSDILFVMSLSLRDAYISKHPEKLE